MRARSNLQGEFLRHLERSRVGGVALGWERHVRNQIYGDPDHAEHNDSESDQELTPIGGARWNGVGDGNLGPRLSWW